jgi:ABC-type nitrate/sulfonate/bicarbonate transport system ATPase subunit
MRTKIEVRELSKGFASDKGRLNVVESVSFSVREGEFVAIVGPSGCGKTTLLNLMAGFIRPDSGTVVIDGSPCSKPDSRGILISQQGSVFPWLTVRENLMFGLNGHAPAGNPSIADHYAEIVGLKGFEDSYPHELSGGMLKRAELARAGGQARNSLHGRAVLRARCSDELAHAQRAAPNSGEGAPYCDADHP